MTNSDEKIKIFISSKVGEQKYDIVRAGLKALIESTGLAKTYVFEDEEASSIPAGRHYLYELEDSHLCIFLIDNKDGIPDGVQKEIDTTNKYNIKSLYYFCTEYSTEETPLQKSLKGAQYAKSKTVNSFKELLTNPAKALLDEIINVYIQYAKGRLDWIDANYSQEGISTILGEGFIITPQIPKSVLSNIDKCKNYFSQFIFQQEIDVKKTISLDAHCYNFMPILFENKSILNFNTALFLQELKKLHSSEKYLNIVEKRWEAVQAYYQGNTSACIDYLNEALSNAKDSSLPEWLIQDILIDLRNIIYIHKESQGTYSISIDAQKELDNSIGVLHYPEIDRFDSNLYEKCLNDDFKEKIKSPHTVTYGNDLKLIIDLLASKFVVASINGSITQMLMLYNQIKIFSYHLISRFSDWCICLMLLKTTILSRRNTDIDGVIRRYDDILCKMNATDAKKVYDFSSCNPIEHEKFISNLEAFRVIGYFLSNDDFVNIWNDLNRRIKNWLSDKKPGINIGYHIFPALSKNIHRIDANSLAEICNQTIEKRFWRFYYEMFSTLESIELSELSPGMLKRLLDNIISVISSDVDNHIVGSLKNILCVFRNKYFSITEPLDTAVKQYMPQFYVDEYKLETSIDNSEEMPVFLQKYIDIVEERNRTQGKNGSYVCYTDNPLHIIRYFIENSKVSFDSNQLNLIFKVATDWLLNTAHTIREKSHAMKLIISLVRKHNEILQRNNDLVLKLQTSKEIITSGRSSLTNLSDISLRLSSQFMFYCFGEKNWISLIEILADIKDDEPSLIHASEAVSHFLEQYTPKELGSELITILLQYSLLWCKEYNYNIRWNAINSLLLLVHDTRCSAVVCNQFVRMMDTDNVYIKNRILWHIEDIKDIDKPTYDYILQKASLDTNFMVRKVYSKIIDKNK